MKQGQQQYLKPELINSISGLSLIARVIVDGYLSGFNQSRRVGPGLEFSQYRGYEPGDDMRLLDWKMLARSGRYYIKQSEIDTHITVKFIIDASSSMQHEEAGLTKMDFVKVLVASLAFLSQKQGDAVGLYALNDQKLYTVHPTVQNQHFKKVLHELIQITPDGKWPSPAMALEALHDRGQKELVFFITDFYEQNDELISLVKSLKTARNEVVVFHIMGQHELDFDYQGHLIFEDLESGSRVKVNAKEAQKTYLDTLGRAMAGTKDALLAKAIGYQLFSMGDPLGEALQAFLKQRNKLS
ncbi:MAG: DUF58 domain-containing protein [Flavobacteriaceae bacterium]